MGYAAEGTGGGKILVVEDDIAARYGMVAALRARRYEVLEASTCAEARSLYTRRPDIVISDLRLPDGDAVGLLPELRLIDPSVPFYIITGYATIDVAVRAVKEGAEEFFTKPVEMDRLLGCLDAVMERRRRGRSGRRMRFSLTEDGPPLSDAMQRLEEEIERLRNADCTVLILGETGTGKTKVARRIHELGTRGKGPFIDINCAGLSRDFVESELFGHERGAFTGAHAQKPGLLDAADGGTMFLDEIGDIDLQVQPKILKVLEERRFRRMGDVRERSADVRLIAATHLDLLDAVERKAFRADLFYRISTVTITMPPLRERKQDIVTIAREVLTQEGEGDVAIDPAAWDKLSSYAWPGNIRELKNVLHRALLLRRGDVISSDDVRFDGNGRTSGQMPAARTISGTMASVKGPPERSTLVEMERNHIQQALLEENGRVKDAALRLGIPRSTLYQKIKTYGIRLPSRNTPEGET